MLSYKLDLQNVHFSHDNYVKKTDGNYVYSDWSYKEFQVELPKSLKKIESEYNSLIDTIITEI